MISNNKLSEDFEIQYTNDFNNPFTDIEITEKGKIPSFYNDIYSIGKMLYYIFTDDDQKRH